MEARAYRRVIFSALVSLILASEARASIIDFGNSTDLGGGSSASVAGYLLGSEIDVSQPATLTAAGILFVTPGSMGEVGVYADNGSGAPGTLVAQTGAFAISSTGPSPFAIETPFLLPVAVPAGNYWFMADFSDTAAVDSVENGTSQYDYVQLDFGDALPSSFPTPQTQTGEAFNYYLVGTVPEPGSLGLLGLTIPAVLLRRHRRTSCGNL